VRQEIETQVEKVDVATLKEAIQALPGYSAQQSTLNTQGGFTLFIGILVIGGFFQIQILQKVSQIGVLKAIGTSNPIVAWRPSSRLWSHRRRSRHRRPADVPVFALLPAHRAHRLQWDDLGDCAGGAPADRAGGRIGLHSLRVRIEPLKALGLNS
jgi:hypothetical protein